MENAHTSYEDLLTPSVLDAVRPYAEKLAKRTRGGLETDDLIHDAVHTLLRRKRAQVDDMTKLLTFRIYCTYCDWVYGENWKAAVEERPPFAAPQDRYMATGTLPIYDGVKQLTVPDPAESWELPLDIERAIHTLNAEEQQLVKWRFWGELYDREIAEQLGVARETVTRRFPAILAKLQKQLLGYGLTEPVGSMLHG